MTANLAAWYTEHMEQKLHPTLAIRLYNDEKCFGPGIAELLERVDEHRSLRAAAQSMGMAYSKAWTTVRRCEAALGFKLLDYTTGGRHGGGASLTTAARELLAAYRDFCRDLRAQADALFASHFAAFLRDGEAAQ